MDNHIEIIVTKLRTRFRAECPLFPQCKGVGPTEEKALLQLSSAIAKMIGKLSKDNLSTLFLSDRYTEVLLDSTKPNKEQHKIYTLDKKSQPKGFMLKYKSKLPEINPTEPEIQRDVQRLINQIDEIIIAQDSMLQLHSDPFMNLEGHDPSSLATEDGFAFGFLLNMN